MILRRLSVKTQGMLSNRINKRSLPASIYVVVAILALALLAYSQAVAYWGDESLHLLAAQLINAGKRPYLDFFYQHTPLFAYLNAGLMRVFGENWRAPHLCSALMTSGCVLLIATYVFTRLRGTKWQVSSAIIAAIFVGLNSYVISFGTVALPYGYCLFFTTASFLLLTEAVDKPRVWTACGAGFCAAAACASYLLVAPVPAIMLLWLIRYNDKGSRTSKAASFLLGGLIPFLPLLYLFSKGPRQMVFDLVQYHLFYRAGHDLGLRFNLHEMAGWFFSVQGFCLAALATIGLLFINFAGRARFQRRQRTEFNLCAWLTLFLSLFISLSRPVSAFYFVLITPFISILATLGVLCVRESARDFGRWTLPIIILLYAIGLYDMRYIWRWQGVYLDHRVVEAAAVGIKEVTPVDAQVYAFEAVYFQARRLPPQGLENRFNPRSQAVEGLAAGRFDTVCIVSTDPKVKSFNLLSRYAQSKVINAGAYDVILLWEKK